MWCSGDVSGAQRRNTRRTARDVAVAAIGLVGMVGCAPHEATLRSTVSPGRNAPFERVVVYSDLEGPGVTHAAASAFEADVVRRLAVCGVEARIVREERMDPTPTDARLAVAMQKLQTATLMVVAAAGGEIGASGSWKYVKLRLTDLENSGPTWIADGATHFSADDVDGAADGAAFAILLVTRLRDDGVLTQCKRGEAYPGCIEDVRQALATRDRPGAARASRPLPRCTALHEDR